jgi:hypothetical protein
MEETMRTLLFTAVALATLTGTAIASPPGLGGGSHPTSKTVGTVTHTQAALTPAQAAAAKKTQKGFTSAYDLDIAGYYDGLASAYHSLAAVYAAVGNDSYAATLNSLAASYGNTAISYHNAANNALAVGQ